MKIELDLNVYWCEHFQQVTVCLGGSEIDEEDWPDVVREEAKRLAHLHAPRPEPLSAIEACKLTSTASLVDVLEIVLAAERKRAADIAAWDKSHAHESESEPLVWQVAPVSGVLARCDANGWYWAKWRSGVITICHFDLTSRLSANITHIAGPIPEPNWAEGRQ